MARVANTQRLALTALGFERQHARRSAADATPVAVALVGVGAEHAVVARRALLRVLIDAGVVHAGSGLAGNLLAIAVIEAVYTHADDLGLPTQRRQACTVAFGKERELSVALDLEREHAGRADDRCDNRILWYFDAPTRTLTCLIYIGQRNWRCVRGVGVRTWSCTKRNARPRTAPARGTHIFLGCATVLVALTNAASSRAASAPCDVLRAQWVGNIGPALAVFDLHVASDGSALLAGHFGDGADLDPTPGVDERATQGELDAFVTKIHADGSYAWSYTVGGSDWEAAEGVATAADGSVLIGGSFPGTVDFDPSQAVDEHTAVGNYNVFVTKLSSLGEYVWTLTFGQGDDSVGSNGLAIDSSGSMVIVGGFWGTADFDPSEFEDIHTSTPTPGGFSADAFITKLSQDGSYIWTRTVGGSGFDAAEGVVVDPDDDIFVIGTFRGTADFDPGPGVDLHTAIGPIEDVFVTKLYSDGSYAWTRTFPARLLGRREPIAVDDQGSVYIVTSFRNTADLDPTEGVDLRTSAGDTDIFVTKLYGDGSYAWTWTAGGPGQDIGRGVDVDAATGNVFVTGSFQETVDFDQGPATDLHTSAGREDIFVTALANDGSYLFTRTMGGTFQDQGKHIAVDPEGGVIVAGSFYTFETTVDFDPSCAVMDRTVHWDVVGDAFIVKLVCAEATADHDASGTVDLLDLASFQACFTGSDAPSCGRGCATLDFDLDDDIDLDDYVIFVESFATP